jgi:hypothetical protein
MKELFLIEWNHSTTETNVTCSDFPTGEWNPASQIVLVLIMGKSDLNGQRN